MLTKHISLVLPTMVLAASLLLSEGEALAQCPAVSAELDSTTIFVGSQVGLNVTISLPQDAAFYLTSLPDTLCQSVEVVDRLKPDTTYEGELRKIAMRYIITSFDTGLHYVPPIPVLILPDSTQALTPEFALSVINPFQQMEYDEQSGVAKICDINSAEDAPFQWRELLLYWPWALGLLLLVGLVFLGLWLYKKYGHKQSGLVTTVKLPDEPCDVIALRDLERIKDERPWMHGRVKEFYSDLTDTLRRYVQLRFNVKAMEATSSELIDSLLPLLRDKKEDLRAIERILQQADFAKFAKLVPSPQESDQDVADAINFVRNTTPVRSDDATGAALVADANASNQPNEPIALAEAKENGQPDANANGEEKDYSAYMPGSSSHSK
ncbi:MAG: hypothetical protein MRZ71_06190 [Bacteroidales bacterium]|nr:hypothetical protein [Bacteroidales bacterium]